MAGERTTDEIQRDIEQARASLAVAVDQLADRTSPKRLADNAKQSIREKVRTPQGKAVLVGVGALLAVLVLRRIGTH